MIVISYQIKVNHFVVL